MTNTLATELRGLPAIIDLAGLKTAVFDVPGIAKRKRVAKAHEEFRARMLVPRADREPKKSKWGSRPFPKRKKSK